MAPYLPITLPAQAASKPSSKMAPQWLEYLRAKRKSTKIPVAGLTEPNDGNLDRTTVIEALQGKSSGNENAPSTTLSL